jgi:putative ABC transport system substrate-binding protein
MRRREFMLMLGGATAAWPRSVQAEQTGPIRRIGVLMPFTEKDAEGLARVKALRQGLEDLGWATGRNLLIEMRWTSGNPDQLTRHAAELVRENLDTIVVSGTTQLLALRRETTTVPIVFANVADPVAAGLVASLAHPGGNITGVTNFESAITGKWVEVLKEAAPHITRILVIYYPANSSTAGQLGAIRTIASSSGVEFTVVPVRDAGEIRAAIEAFARKPNGGVIALPDANIGMHRKQIISLTVQHRLPALYPLRYFATDGGLMSYGADPYDLFRQSASYVDRILKGEKPGDLPVQTPTKFELVINLKAAQSIGLSVSPMLLIRADEVIE